MTNSSTEKYTHPSAYFPDFDHGSCLIAAISAGGVFFVIGMLIRLERDWRDDASDVSDNGIRKEGMMCDVPLLPNGADGIAPGALEPLLSDHA